MHTISDQTGERIVDSDAAATPAVVPIGLIGLIGTVPAGLAAARPAAAHRHDSGPEA